MLYVIGIGITFFLVAVLLSKRPKARADRILLIWLFVMGLHLSFYYLFASGTYINYTYLLGIELPFPLLHGPFLFLYTAALTGQNQYKKYQLLHFIPFLATYSLFFSFFFLSPGEKIAVYEAKGVPYQSALRVMAFEIALSGATYVVLSLLLLKKHRKNISRRFSYAEKINLNWLRYLIFGIGLIWLTVLFGKPTHTYTVVVVFIFFIGFFGIRQEVIFTSKQYKPVLPHPPKVTESAEAIPVAFNETIMHPQQKETKESTVVKYQKSSLTEERVKAIHQSLKKVMETEKPFQNPTLTLAELAAKINVTSNALSQVINTVEQRNFFDYINAQRIEEFKRLTRAPENAKFTIIALAYDCGFNSKSSFNRNFKKYMSISPSQYLKEEKIKLS